MFHYNIYNMTLLKEVFRHFCFVAFLLQQSYFFVPLMYTDAVGILGYCLCYCCWCNVVFIVGIIDIIVNVGVVDIVNVVEGSHLIL